MSTNLQNCRVYPSSSSSSNNPQEFSTPLTHFDIPFLLSDPTQRLIFFDLHCSKPQFHDDILPSLKTSLSNTLSHFLPLAGKVVLPLNSGVPLIRYVSGEDSVSLTIAESDQDFHYLTSHNQRVADEFYACLPQLPPPTRCADSVIFPVMSLQITLFSGKGICVGITNHHAVRDESSTVHFLKVWACANRLGDAEAFKRTLGGGIPVLDRFLVENPESLDSNAWEYFKTRLLHAEQPPLLEFPIDRIRSTFLLTKDQIKTLKNYASLSNPNLSQISSFVVISAYVGICSEKAAAAADHDDAVYFSFAANCRGRLNPPLPESYFGNCLVFVCAEARRGLLKKNEGFLIGAESIAEAIETTLKNDDRGILETSDWPFIFRKLSGKHVMSVAGSPRFDVYEADFGWGKARKHEFVHLDRERSFSLSKSRDLEGGFEIGLSRRKPEMDAFENIFRHGLESLCHNDSYL